MKLKSKIENGNCNSLEERIERRNYLRNIIKDGKYEEQMEYALNNSYKYKFLKKIDCKITIDDMGDYIIFNIRGDNSHEDCIAIINIVKGQLSDGTFENWECLSWDVDRV